MANLTIKSDNKPREVLDAWTLSPAERAEFDYLDWTAIDAGSASAQFVRFGGQLYDLGEFCRVIPAGSKRCHPCESDAPEFAGWDGYMSDSYFSGMLIRWARDERGEPDFERVIVGRYMC